MNARGYLQDINNTKHSGRMMIFTPAILGVKGESRLGGGFSWVSNAIFAFPSIFFCDWCRKLALYSQTIKCKLKSRFKQSEHFSPRVAAGSLQHFCFYWMVLWFFFGFGLKQFCVLQLRWLVHARERSPIDKKNNITAQAAKCFFVTLPTWLCALNHVRYAIWTSTFRLS